MFLLFTTAINSYSSIPNSDTSTPGCKTRIDDILNSYQETIVPVLTLDGNTIYIDRKLHPDNSGGVYDQDEIWHAQRQPNGIWTEPSKFGTRFNSPKSDVLFYLSPDASLALIYRDNSDSTAAGKSPFYFIRKRFGNWSQPETIEIENYYNHSPYFYAAMSADNTVMLLAIERAGGLGGLDLYASFYDKLHKRFSEPKTLGNLINTPGTESSPCLAYDGKTMYFASDRAGGCGKLDLYYSSRLDDTWQNWSPPINLGPRINTSHDENSIWLTATGDSACIASWDSLNHRSGIYWVCLPADLQPQPYLLVTGKIIYEGNIEGNEAHSAKINIFCEQPDGSSSRQQILVTANNYAIILPNRCDCSINIHLEGYLSYDTTFDTGKLMKAEWIDRDIVLSQSGVTDPTVVAVILFDFDSDSLNENSVTDIKESILSLGSYLPARSNNFDFGRASSKKPDKDRYQTHNRGQILVFGYTDSVGTDDYNKKLSLRRAENVAKTLVKIGVDRKQIKAVGKGKSFKYKDNDKANRRVEIMLIK